MENIDFGNVVSGLKDVKKIEKFGSKSGKPSEKKITNPNIKKTLKIMDLLGPTFFSESFSDYFVVTLCLMFCFR